MKRPELLAPAGNMEALKAAVANGADAVYLGASRFGARAFAGNFHEDQLQEAVRYCHLRDVKVYVTVNTLLYEEELAEAIALVDRLVQAQVDALIVQDLGLVSLIRRRWPDLELHASTQMHIHNLDGVRWAKDMGFSRVVLARETPLELVRECAREKIDLEIFVYGALCVSYSGECLMSSLLQGRSGNRGQCAQPCRMRYQLIDETQDKVVPAEGEYLLSTRDLNTLDRMKELMNSGAVSFKIEGRMKRPEYVGAVVRAFRRRIDALLQQEQIRPDPQEQQQLKKLFNRGFTEGYLFHQSGFSVMNAFRPNHLGVQIATVLSQKNGRLQIRLSAPLHQHDGLRILRDHGEDLGFLANYIYRHGLLVSKAEAGDIVELEVRDKVRPGSAVLQTTDALLMKQLQRQSATPYRRIPLIMEVSGQAGTPLQLQVSDKQGHQLAVYSQDALSPALSSPLTEQRIEAQLNKLKETPYCIESCRITLDGDVFLPLQQLNELRRQAIEGMNQLRLKRPALQPVISQPSVRPVNNKPQIAEILIEVETWEQWEALKDLPVQLISSWPQLWKEENVIASQLRVVPQSVSLPGRCIQVQQLGALNNPQQHLLLTQGFNVTNSEALQLLLSLPQVDAVEFSLETSGGQQRQIRKAFLQRCGFLPPTIQWVYGARDLMISAACPVNRLLKDGKKKNCRLCHQRSYALRSIHREHFPLLGDSGCFSHLLEAEPYRMPEGDLDPSQSWKLRMTRETGPIARQLAMTYLQWRQRLATLSKSDG